MKVAADLLEEAAFMRRDHDDVSCHPLTAETEPQHLISHVTITDYLDSVPPSDRIPLSRHTDIPLLFLWRRKSGPWSEQRALY